MSPLPRLPSFRERAPWWGGDLQTIGTAFRGLPAANGNRSSSEPMSFPLPDGDTLLATLDRPATRDESRPLAVVIHGCPGAEDSPSVLWAAHLLLAKGYCVLRPNLRGAGRSRTTCGGQYYAGSSRDVGALLAQLPADLTQAGVIAIGHSLGGAILLKYLGERSYGLYLWHWPIFMVLRPGIDLDADGIQVQVLRFALTFAAAELSFDEGAAGASATALAATTRGAAAEASCCC